MRIPFTKMQGAGNDYIYVDTTQTPLPHPEALAVAWSRRHTGIGSDGLVLIGRSDRADFSMRIFNADGSEARMCGNASRCIGKYVYEHGLTDKTDIALDTLSGIKTLHLHVEDGTVDTNYFQHQPYLDDFNAQNCTHLVTVAGIHVEPMGIYGGKQTSLDPIQG